MEEERLLVPFLGVEYSFPKDILTYKNELQYFESLRKELMDFMLKFYGDFTSLPKNSDSLAYNRFVSIADKCVKRLFNFNLFHVTVEDFIGSKPESFSVKDIEEKSTNKGLTLFLMKCITLCLNKDMRFWKKWIHFLTLHSKLRLINNQKLPV